MSNFKVSKVPFYQPNFGFNRTGNNSPTVADTPTIAPFDYQYSASTVKKGEKRQQALFPKVGTTTQGSNPQQGPNPQPTAVRQPVRPMRRIQPKPIEPQLEPEEDENEENNLELNKQ